MRRSGEKEKEEDANGLHFDFFFLSGGY
jgi:hypothetical protein